MKFRITLKSIMMLLTVSALLTALFIPFLSYLFSGISMFINYNCYNGKRSVYILNSVSASCALISHMIKISGI